MSIDLKTPPDELLERRLRAACTAVIPRLLEASSTQIFTTTAASDDAEVEVGQRSADHRRSRVLSLAAAVLVLAGIGALWATQRGAEQPDAATATPPTVAAVPGPTTVPVTSLVCDDSGCGSFDKLPVVAGVADFYSGPPELGTPTIALDKFESLTRCAELTADFAACQRVEGIAGVSLVTYDSILIGTTFTEITPSEYATAWFPTGLDRADVQEAVTVRGHAAIRYLDQLKPAVVWQERPGVLVWVVVSPSKESRLLTIAEAIVRRDGPTAIPNRVVITPLAGPWKAQDNDGNGLIVAIQGGLACVGINYIDLCDSTIEATIVRPTSSGPTRVGGATPPDVTRVRIDVVDAEPLFVDTITFANYQQRFYATTIPSGYVAAVSWLDSAGEVVASLGMSKPEPPDTPNTATAVSANGSSLPPETLAPNQP